MTIVNPLTIAIAITLIVFLFAWLSVSGEIHKENMRTISADRRDGHHR
jgi:hypothetical protein